MYGPKYVWLLQGDYQEVWWRVNSTSVNCMSMLPFQVYELEMCVCVTVSGIWAGNVWTKICVATTRWLPGRMVESQYQYFSKMYFCSDTEGTGWILQHRCPGAEYIRREDHIHARKYIYNCWFFSFMFYLLLFKEILISLCNVFWNYHELQDSKFNKLTIIITQITVKTELGVSRV